MKKRKLIAIIGVFSMCISLVAPVYAEEPQNVMVQSETEEIGEAKTEEVAEPEVEESTEIKEEELTESKAKEAEETNEQNNAELYQESVATDQAETSNEISNDFVIPEDYTGWDDLNEHYYVNGEMLTDVYCQIGEEYYAFDVNGYILSEYRGWLVSFEYGYENVIRTDTQGILLRNSWYLNEYYDEAGCGIREEAREIEGKLYYFDYSGYKVTSQKVVWDGTLYYADEEGVLTAVVIDEEKNGWEQIGDGWYWYEKGEIVTDQIITYNGSEYYLNWEGKMVTGSFWYYDNGPSSGKYMLAEVNGQIVRSSANRWYYSSEGKYYWFKAKDEIASGEFLPIGNAKYYFGYDGIMAVGRFRFENDNGNWVECIAGSSGAVYEQKSWIYINGEYYYQDENGLVTNQKKQIGGKLYVFDYNGVMQVGHVYHYNDETGKEEYYFTDVSGAVKTGGWVQDGPDWYYAGTDGRLVCEGWIGKYYFDYEGNMVTGIEWIEGKKYVFSSSGALIEEIGDFAGWKKYDGIWYFYDAPNEPHDGWLNNTYYIEDGRMLVDQVINVDDENYYLGYNGVKQKGWIFHYGTWYYGENDGAFATGWTTIGYQKYWFDEDGQMAIGIEKIDGEYHRFGESGAWLGNLTKDGKEGWIQNDGYWYWWNADGTYATGKQKIGGRDYYFHEWGEMRADEIFWDDENEEWVRVGASGARIALTNGWTYVSESWYYFENGKPAEGLKKIGASTYYFASGRMLKGYHWNDILQKYSFFSDSGAMQEVTTGWYSVTQDGYKEWYYFVNGKPATGWKNIGSAWYQFYWDGSMKVGRVGDYIFAENGALVRNGWVKVYDTWFYADANGRVLRGEHTIGTMTYWFSHEGVWLK